MPAFKELLVVANGRAAQAASLKLGAWDSLAERLKALGGDVEIALPKSLVELDDLMKQSADCVVAVGGDGTIRQVVQRLDLPNQTLGVLPLGGGNDFAQALGMPLKWDDAVEALVGAEPRAIDFGRVAGGVIALTGGSRPEARFVNSLGFGIDAASIQMREKWKSPPGGYVTHFLLSLAALKPAAVEAEIDGKSLREKVFWFLVMNGATIGGGVPIIPGSGPSTGRLHYILIRQCPKWKMLTILPKALKGAHLNDSAVKWGTADRIVISEPKEVVLAADGDVASVTMPLTIECAPGALTALVAKK